MEITNYDRTEATAIHRGIKVARKCGQPLQGEMNYLFERVARIRLNEQIHQETLYGASPAAVAALVDAAGKVTSFPEHNAVTGGVDDFDDEYANFTSDYQDALDKLTAALAAFKKEDAK